MQQQHQQQFAETNTFVSSLSGYSEEQQEENQLRVDLEDRFHGRKEESTVLQKAFTECLQSSSRLVWVEGRSGVGKTSLVVEVLRNRLVGQNHFCMGKFDQARQRCEPYSALFEALLELCDLIVQGNYTSHDVQQQPQSKSKSSDLSTPLTPTTANSSTACPSSSTSQNSTVLGRDVRILTKLISKLTTLDLSYGNTDNDNNDNDNATGTSNDRSNPPNASRNKHDAMSQKAMFTRFKLICRTFLRSVSAHMPVVIFLDDLQWADEGSLRVLQGLIEDNDSSRVLIVGAYREEALHTNQLLADMVTKSESFCDENLGDESTKREPLQGNRSKANSNSGSMTNGQKRTYHAPTTRLRVGALTVHALNDYITSLTGANDTAASYALSQVIWNKTHGNAFFVVRFLEMLFERGLLCKEKETPNGLSSSSLTSVSIASGGGEQRKNAGAVVGAVSASVASSASTQLTGKHYSWDTERIQRETNVCDNVADLVEAKIQKLPRRVQAVLKMAACLGYTIHLDVLHDVLKDQRKPVDDHRYSGSRSHSKHGLQLSKKKPSLVT